MNVAARSRQFVMTYDNAEALKWLAFGSMLIDHANKVFAGGGLAWAVPLGRIAFPLFAFLIGRHLLADRLLSRLVIVGALVTIPYALALTHGLPLPLNILWTFAFAAGVVRLLTARRVHYAGFLFVLGALVCDYSMPGLLLVISSWAWWQHRSWATSAMLASSLGLLCVLNGNAFALLSVPLVLFASVDNWRVPRVRNFFWIAYPVHLAVFAALAIMLGRV